MLMAIESRTGDCPVKAIFQYFRPSSWGKAAGQNHFSAKLHNSVPINGPKTMKPIKTMAIVLRIMVCHHFDLVTFCISCVLLLYSVTEIVHGECYDDQVGDHSQSIGYTPVAHVVNSKGHIYRQHYGFGGANQQRDGQTAYS